MDKYLNNLILQFQKATGIKNIDISSDSFIREFNEWLLQRKLIIPDYREFIIGLNTEPYIDFDSVEIGKGIHDSITIDTNISMITPYTGGIIKTPGSLINGELYIFDGQPFVKQNFKLVNCLDYSRFITQNPYISSDVKNWEQLHNSGSNITVGIYGYIYDKDIDSKVKLMRELKSKLLSDFILDYSTNGYEYMYVISSKRKILKKEERIKTR